MKKLIISIIALLSILPAGLRAEGSKDSNPRTGLTVMSYNVRMAGAEDGTNSWQYRYPASAMMIDEIKPDIIGMQECENIQHEYFGEVLKKTYKIIGVGREDGNKEGERMSVMYNAKTVSLLKWGTFWLSETPEKPSMGWDAACFRCATWAFMKDKATGRKFLFVNTHLDHMGAEAQKNGLQVILDHIASLNTENLPVVLTGDFNMEISNPAFATIKNQMSNARETGVVTDDHYTYNGWGKAKDTIDYIWYKGFGSCISFETVTKPYMDRTFISDHYPIKAVFVF